MNENPKIKSLENGIKILNLISDTSPISVTALSEKVGLTKSAVSKILSTFKDYKYVEQNSLDKTFTMGSEMIRLGMQGFSKIDIRSLAKQYLQELSDKYNENTMLMIEQQLKAVVLEVCTAKNYDHLSMNLGRQYVLYRGAAPKVLLAYLSEDRKKNVIEMADWLPMTDNTITSEEVLHERLQEIRTNGFDISLGEFDTTTLSIAVPLVNGLGEIKAAISISGTKERMNMHDKADLISDMKYAAKLISEKLGASNTLIEHFYN